MAEFIAGTAAAGGGALIGGYFSNQASQRQQDAAQYAADTQRDIYNQQRADQAPYRQAGYGALSQIQANMPEYNKQFTAADFEANKDPGYQWRLEQGQNAINRAAGASGGAVGASALQSLGNYSQGAASQEYQSAFNRYQQQINNSFNRLSSVAGLGQTSLGQTGQAGTAAGAGIAGSIQGGGNAAAAGQIGIGNAITGGISQGVGMYQSGQMTSALHELGANSAIDSALDQNSASSRAIAGDPYLRSIGQ